MSAFVKDFAHDHLIQSLKLLDIDTSVLLWLH